LTAFGRALRLEVRGASHAPFMEFAMEGFPQGFRFDADALRAFMERRAPGRDALSTQRREADEVEWTAGVADGVTTGGVVAGRIANRDMRPKDYGAERTVPRPGHADFGQWVERGSIPTGGGENSGRLTAPLCAAGGLCLQFLASRGVEVRARLESAGGDSADPDAAIRAARDAMDSVGGVVSCEATGMPAGIGGALFGGIETELAGALFAIPGVKGVEFGNGFASAALRGSENNDEFTVSDGEVRTATNRHGGILGGRTTGMPVTFRVAMKPTPTIFKAQRSVDLATMEPAVCEMKGRHDPCIARRAVPVVEAVAAFALADAILAAEAKSPRVCMTLTGRTLAEDLAQYRSQRHFTDMVELRADLLDVGERELAAEFPAMVPVPAILTFRRRRDGGAFDGTDDERAEFFRRVLGGRGTAVAKAMAVESGKGERGFAFVDFEDDFRRDDLAALARGAGARVIRSLHDFSGPVADVPGVCHRMRGATDEIPKVAFMPKSEADVERLFEETRDFDDIPHVALAMGPLGLPTRTGAARTHSMLTYASVGGLGSIGHVSPRDLVRSGIRMSGAIANAPSVP